MISKFAGIVETFMIEVQKVLSFCQRVSSLFQLDVEIRMHTTAWNVNFVILTPNF